MPETVGTLAKNAYSIVSNEYIEQLREDDEKTPNPYNIIVQAGGQEKFLTTSADITIYGGSRGGGKSMGILLDALNDVLNPNFRALVMRNEKNDLDDLIETSYGVYGQFGEYNKSKDDMTWNFHSGGFLRFGYYSDAYEDFKKRWQGKQFSYIAIDEITHMTYEKFKYIITDNRNAHFLRNRIYGTCNPDPDSWVAEFIRWWIGDDGFPIPWRDGKVRYCFMDGDNPATIVWGDTREEVYEQCKETIDRYWREEMAQYGRPQDIFISSVCFIEGKVTDNKQLLRSDPAYLARLMNQSEEQRARDLDGNWKFKEVGDDIIKIKHMEAFFENPRQASGGKPYASCDIALDGGDNLVMWKFLGEWRHIDDVFVCKLDGSKVVGTVRAKLEEWGVSEDCFTYDLNGLGKWFQGHFKKAVPFVNQAGVEKKMKYIYENLKSQAASMFADAVINKEISIRDDLLDRRFSGIGYKNLPLRLILLNERKAIRKDQTRTEHGFALPKKAVMKKLVGHSPDFIEALFMIMIFKIQKHRRQIRGIGLL